VSELTQVERMALGLVRVGWLQEGVDCTIETVERIIADRERTAEVRALREAAQDFPLTPHVTLQGVRICEMLHYRAARIETEGRQ
jgi:hypothetical protein